jgi:NAD(P)-dependent dehydrogenase (short-subunit alcohol dehydrogenase family)
MIGPMQLCKFAIPWMLRAGGGHIVNVLSIAATHPFSGAAAYCASKAGLHMFGKALAAEYRGRGIRVTSLLPGSTDTPLWDKQSFQPSREDMLPARAVAECIRDVILSPPDRSYDEIVLMPPKGIL